MVEQRHHFGSEDERRPFRAQAEEWNRDHSEWRAKHLRNGTWTQENENRYQRIHNGLQVGDSITGHL